MTGRRPLAAGRRVLGVGLGAIVGASAPVMAAVETPVATWSAGRVPVFVRAQAAAESAAAPPTTPDRSLAGRAAAAQLPAFEPSVPAMQFDAEWTGSTRTAPTPDLASRPTGAKTDGRPPGYLQPSTSLPGYFLKDKTVAPHVSPDVEVGLNERTSVGMYGELTRINREDVRNNTVREGRDVGAGFTLQYKFNSR